MTDASSSRAAAFRQPADPQLGKSGQLVVPTGVALREQETDGLRGKASGHEGEHLCRGPIKPLDVIDDADQRMLLRRVGQQAEQGQSDQKSIWLRARAQPERGRHGVTLWRRQPSATVQQSRAQLMQAGERELHLPFGPKCAQDPASLGALDGVLQERRFADSVLAAEHQHRGLPQPRFCQQPIEPRALGPAAHQRSRRVPKGERSHPTARISPPVR
jgi:hypothetical protein